MADRLLDKRVHFNLWYFVLALVLLIVLRETIMQSQVATIPYSEFLSQLDAGEVIRVVVSDTEIRGELKTPIDGKTLFETTRIEPDFAAQLYEHEVEVTGTIQRGLMVALAAWFLPLTLLLALWYVIGKRIGSAPMGGGFMQIGKSKAKVYMESDTNVTFDDVAGVDEALEELKEIVAFLREPQRYGRLGGHVPKGVLLVGPPGTGKTLLARAVAGEAGVPFFSINGSEFVEMFVGVGAARVRDLFDQARQQVPCIIFIDELDALGRARGLAHLGGGHDEKEQTLNQLLSELDGFDPSEGLVLLAATNRPEILDPALLRAGRFDRQVLVDRPDRPGRVAILKVHMKKAKLAPEVQADEIASLTPGFTGADLMNLVNEATLLATRRGADAVSMDDFTRAIERIVAGLEKKNRLLNPQERRSVAYHEMGHALLAMMLSDEQVHKVSIIPRGIGALGYTIQRPLEDRYLMTEAELEDKLAVLLGGRAAEQVILQRLSTGAADDLAKATELARNMVTRYGMAPALGPVSYDRIPSPVTESLGAPPYTVREHSETTAHEIDCEIRRLLDAAFDKACGLLDANRDVLQQGTEQLLAQETITEEQLTEIAARLQPAPESQSG